MRAEATTACEMAGCCCGRGPRGAAPSGRPGGRHGPLAHRKRPAPGQVARAATGIGSIARAVEELVGNALDARAGTVRVLADLRRLRLSVEDDGVGIRALHDVAAPNATSKLGKRAQRQLLEEGRTPTTHGFRGEALHGLSFIGVLEIESRERSSVSRQPARRKTVKDGRELFLGELSEPALDYGTRVSLCDIFGSTPVRRAILLRSAAQELAKVRALLERFALASPSVRFILVDGWREDGPAWEFSGGHCSTRDAFCQLYGSAVSAKLCDRFVSRDGVEIAALVSAPAEEALEKTSHLQFWFVNGRPMQRRRRIEGLINKLYRDALFEPGEARRTTLFPCFVLSISCDTALYDILLEPSKAVVEFHDWPRLLRVVKGLFAHMFPRQQPRPLREPLQADLAGEEADLSQDSTVAFERVLDAASFSRFFLPDDDEDDDDDNDDSCGGGAPNHQCNDAQQQQRRQQRPVEPGPVPVSAPGAAPKPQAIENKDTPAVPPGDTAAHGPWSMPLPKRDRSQAGLELQASAEAQRKRRQLGDGVRLTAASLAEASVIAQVGAKFILLRHNSQILCVDQHAADERVRLEAFEKEILRDGLASSILQQHDFGASAPALSLSVSQREVLAAARGQLEKWGFRVGPGAPAPALHLRSVPAVFGLPVGMDAFYEALEFVRDAPRALDRAMPPPVRRAIVSRACHGAIKFGDALDPAQCRRLIARLAQCTFPFQCAHGRPTCCPLAAFG